LFRWSLPEGSGTTDKDLDASKLLGNKTAADGAQVSCGGQLAAPPMIGLTVSECAKACNVLAPSSADNYCVAFQHFKLDNLLDAKDNKEVIGGYGPLEDSWGERPPPPPTVFDADSEDGWSWYYQHAYYDELAAGLTKNNETAYGDPKNTTELVYSYYYEDILHSPDGINETWQLHGQGLDREGGGSYDGYEDGSGQAGGFEMYTYPLCFLLSDLKEIAKYNCEYGKEWRDCADSPADWYEAGRQAITCEWHAYSPEFCPKKWFRGYDASYAMDVCGGSRY
jgi:hypothetical protein